MQTKLLHLIKDIPGNSIVKREYGDIAGYWYGTFTIDNKDFHYIMDKVNIIGIWYMPFDSYKTYGYISNPKIYNKPLMFTKNLSEDELYQIIKGSL